MTSKVNRQKNRVRDLRGVIRTLRFEAKRARRALVMVEATMSITEPRSNKADYLSTLYAVRAVLADSQPEQGGQS